MTMSDLEKAQAKRETLNRVTNSAATIPNSNPALYRRFIGAFIGQALLAPKTAQALRDDAEYRNPAIPTRASTRASAENQRKQHNRSSISFRLLRPALIHASLNF